MKKNFINKGKSLKPEQPNIQQQLNKKSVWITIKKKILFLASIDPKL